MVRSLQYCRAEQFNDEFFAEFDLLRREAKSKMEMGEGFLEQSASILRIKNAGLPGQKRGDRDGQQSQELEV